MANRKFKIKCIAVSLKGNKIGRNKDGKTYDQSSFAGDVDVLIKDGYITEIESKDEPKELSEMTVVELKGFVEENELDVDLDQNKPELLASIIEATKDK